MSREGSRSRHRHPDFGFNYTTYLALDSTQYLETTIGTFFGGSWEHFTTGSTRGDTGTFTGVVTPSLVSLILTYDIPHAPCGATERLEGPALPNGQWGTLRNVFRSQLPGGYSPARLRS
jgi:hypothetical protein